MTNETYNTKYYYKAKVYPQNNLSLSLLIGQYTFIFAVFNNNSTCVELGHIKINPHSQGTNMADHVSFLCNNYLLHQKKYEKVQLALVSNNFTMVPEAFATVLDKNNLLNFTTGNTAVQMNRHHHLNGLNFNFAIEPSLLSFLESNFSNISIRHAGAVALQLGFNHHSLLHSQVFLNMHDFCVELLIKENNKLIFYNNFRFDTNEDVLYYLLFAMEQFNLDPLQVKLSIGGQLDVASELTKSIKRYVKQVSFCAHHPSVKMTEDLSSLPEHYYFTTLNQHLCEL